MQQDTIVVTRTERLARSLKDLQDIVHDLKTRGIYLEATEQPVDTKTAAGKAFLDMLGIFAEFETSVFKLIKEFKTSPRRSVF
ncbi:recombinase family protein [Pseudoalteromonas tetraodonis]|uniref:recombinase family protein n=1 Tax=Pseudoalteromonas tetraodonis TaxID=43659 RepID=UPI003CFF42EB